jgi:hypothetical protein
LYAAIGHDFEASEEDTISIWEPIAALTKGLAKVSGDADANSIFPAQTKLSLPTLNVNLEKLSAHYRKNMPLINKALSSSQA